jgi:hypothetical protein
MILIRQFLHPVLHRTSLLSSMVPLLKDTDPTKVWKALAPIITCPDDRPLTRYGGAGDGGKLLCRIPKDMRQQCVIYSLGSNGECQPPGLQDAIRAAQCCLHTTMQQFAHHNAAVCTPQCSSLHTTMQQSAHHNAAVCTPQCSSLHTTMQQFAHHNAAVCTPQCSSLHTTMQQMRAREAHMATEPAEL